MLSTFCRTALFLSLVANAVSAEARDDEEDTYLGGEPDPELGEVSQDTAIPEPLTVYAGVRLGLGGEVAYDPGGSEDLRATLGIQAGADYVITKYFAVGGELRISSWTLDFRAERGDGRSLLFDFVARPRGRYVFGNMPLEIYGTLPLGLSVPSINDDWDADGTAGFTLGFGAGANYFISEKLGFGGELIYMKHWIGWESRAAGEGEADLSLGQINFVGNVVYAL